MGEHLTIYPNINQPVPGPGAANPRAAYIRLLAAITEVSHGESSDYNGLQVTAERRFYHGLAFMASYTWGHAMDITSTTAGGGVQNPLCLGCDRGPSDFDIRHSLTLSWSYELPFGKGKPIGNNWNGPMNAVFGGWKFNSIDTFQSGSPFSVNSGTNTEGSGGGTQRANVIGDYHPANQDPNLWFNPAAFTAPAAYTYGNSGRNIIVGPGTNQIDFSLVQGNSAPGAGRHAPGIPRRGVQSLQQAAVRQSERIWSHSYRGDRRRPGSCRAQLCGQSGVLPADFAGDPARDEALLLKTHS